MPPRKKPTTTNAARKPRTPAPKRSARVAPKGSDIPVPFATVAPVAIPHELVAGRAYKIWQEKTARANDSVQNWLEAEAEIRERLHRL